MKRTPTRDFQTPGKRNLSQTSPEMPMDNKRRTDNIKVADLTLEQLTSVLATKNDFLEMRKEINTLKEEIVSYRRRISILESQLKCKNVIFRNLDLEENASSAVMKI